MYVSQSDAPANESGDAVTCKMTRQDLMDVVRVVEDPDLGMSIVDLGLIYDIRNDNGDIEVDMTLTSPGCPYGPQIVQEVTYVLNVVEGVKSVHVEIVWDPPWTMENISDEIKLEMGIDY